MRERTIAYLRLADIRGANENPKKHDAVGIARSISEFGLGELPLLDERTDRIVAGHGRIDDLRERQATGGTPPPDIRVDHDGEWLIPVQAGWSSADDAHARAYVAASNKLSETGGWDTDLLPAYLQDLDAQGLLELSGFTDDELAALLDDGTVVDETGLRGDPDDAPAVPADPVSAPGDLWLLGRHRLIVADCTDLAAVDRLMAGQRGDMMWTDPPYGVDYVGKTKRALTIRNDAGPAGLEELLAGAWATATAALAPGAAWYMASPPGPQMAVFMQSVTQAGWLYRQNLVWAKNTMVLGRSDYHYQHEPILYGFTDGGQGRLGRGGERWYGDNAQTTVFDVDRPGRSSEHPTMKPVALIQAMLGNSCRPGGLVCDWFAGSGSTMIAAHAHGAAARLIELDPAYADVICRRFQQLCGGTPVLEATGEPHDFTAQD